MATLIQSLERQISRLEKELPDSRLLKDLKRQYRGLKFNQGKDLKEVYFAGMTGETQDSASEEWPTLEEAKKQAWDSMTDGALPASRLEEDDK